MNEMVQNTLLDLALTLQATPKLVKIKAGKVVWVVSCPGTLGPSVNILPGDKRNGEE